MCTRGDNSFAGGYSPKGIIYTLLTMIRMSESIVLLLYLENQEQLLMSMMRTILLI